MYASMKDTLQTFNTDHCPKLKLKTTEHLPTNNIYVGVWRLGDGTKMLLISMH